MTTLENGRARVKIQSRDTQHLDKLSELALTVEVYSVPPITSPPSSRPVRVGLNLGPVFCCCSASTHKRVTWGISTLPSNLIAEVDAGGMFGGPEDRPDAHHELVFQSGERMSIMARYAQDKCPKQTVRRK
jgi:hypothetical protein